MNTLYFLMLDWICLHYLLLIDLPEKYVLQMIYTHRQQSQHGMREQCWTHEKCSVFLTSFLNAFTAVFKHIRFFLLKKQSDLIFIQLIEQSIIFFLLLLCHALRRKYENVICYFPFNFYNVYIFCAWPMAQFAPISSRNLIINKENYCLDLLLR